MSRLVLVLALFSLAFAIAEATYGYGYREYGGISGGISGSNYGGYYRPRLVKTYAPIVYSKVYAVPSYGYNYGSYPYYGYPC